MKNAAKIPVPRKRRFKTIKKKRPPITAETVGSSNLEVLFESFMKGIGIEVETQHKIAYKFFDYKVKGKNILVELDGDYWHCNPDKYPNGPINGMQKRAIKNDFYKDCLAKNNGYTLIRIWEDEFKKHPELVKKKLLSLI